MSHDLLHALFSKHLAILFRREESRHDRVDAHSFSRPLACKVLRDVVNGRLAHGVAENARERGDAGHRTNVDYRRLNTMLKEVLAEHLAGNEDGLGVRLESREKVLAN
jgi:hypothetical protein